MRDLSVEECDEVSGGVVPIALGIGYLYGGLTGTTIFLAGLANGIAGSVSSSSGSDSGKDDDS